MQIYRRIDDSPSDDGADGRIARSKRKLKEFFVETYAATGDMLVRL